MLFEESEVNSVQVMKVLERRIAADTAGRFRSQIIEKVKNGTHAVVLDLENVTFIDSSGIGALVSVLKTLGSRCAVGLCGVRGAVAAAFRLSRMDRVFLLYGNASEALAALAPAHARQ